MNEDLKKGRLFFGRKNLNWVKIEIDLDLAEFQLAWQFNKLFVWWNAEEITDYVKDVKFICDEKGQSKYAELTVLEELLIPRSFRKISDEKDSKEINLVNTLVNKDDEKTPSAVLDSVTTFFSNETI